MTGAAEMRRVMEHATDGLRAAAEAQRRKSFADLEISIPIAYAVGVLDLLATYLIDGDSSGDVGPEPRLTNKRLHDCNGDLWVLFPGCGDTWGCANHPELRLSKHQVEQGFSPVREVWVR